MKRIQYYETSEALAFSDVYLRPAYSDIRSRFGNQIDLATVFSNRAPRINIPIISAGMDTVTEYKMATIIALNGGIGEIHRNNTPEEQSHQIRLVKEKMRFLEEDPPRVFEDTTIEEVLKLLERRERGYVMVFKKGSNKKLLGIATNKDFLAADIKTKISKVMTPLAGSDERKLIVANKNITLEKAYKIMIEKRIEKLPVLDRNKNLVGVYTIQDYNKFKNYPQAATDKQGRLLVGAAIGVHEVDIERAIQVTKAGADVLFIDIAHGHSIYSKEMVKRLKIREKISTPIIVGNVATNEGVKFACDIGADGVKVGIGPGFVCKTRTVAGTGVPQVTAIMEARNEIEKRKKAIPIISDGGVREPGDVAKAIAAGADSVMIGTIFSGTDASPGDLIKMGGILKKRVRGMSTKKVLEERKKISKSTTDISVYAEEGRETFTPYQGSTEEVLHEILGGLRSAMSYTGSHTIKELQKAKLIHISGYGANEQKRPLNTD